MSSSIALRLALAAAFALVAGCTTDATGGGGTTTPPHETGGGGSGGAAPGPAQGPAPAPKAHATPAPAALVGTWTAGRGGTTVSYDALTGTSSSSNASGLAFQFASDGTFAKAYRDSNGGSCPMIVLATEAGTVEWGSSDFVLHSDHGTSKMWSSCSPGAVATQSLPDADLDRDRYAFQLDGEELVLTRASDAATARFRRSQ
jgi:hypothetical protein